MSMNGSFDQNDPQTSKSIARQWLYETLARVETAENLDGERVSTNGGKTLTITLTFKED